MAKMKKFKVVVNGVKEEKALMITDPVVYHLEADSKANALKKAKKEFGSEHPEVQSVIARVNKVNVISICFLLFACFISFIPWHSADGSIISLRPSLIPGIFSLIIYSSVVVRLKGIKNSITGVSDFFCNCLIMVLIASFISLLCGDAEIKLWKFIIPISGKLFLLIAAMLSWLGMENVAKFVWIGLLVLAAIRIVAADALMGIWGLVFIFSGFFGIFFYLKQQSDDFLIGLQGKMISLAKKPKSLLKFEKSGANE